MDPLYEDVCAYKHLFVTIYNYKNLWTFMFYFKI